MELAPRECGLLDADVAPFAAIAGDRRTGSVLGDVIHGIIGGESLVCAQIAAVSPRLAAGRARAQRIRRSTSSGSARAAGGGCATASSPAAPRGTAWGNRGRGG